ncbi:LysR family transcriptional regulator [Acidocella facilis]|uniref:LysR family transcriptional regulator n=1 Tax=Acidocella facilis TaxID=525 RepID=UPI001F33738A|nr:LysR family transcriptional regulator [Acidocella facilis]
MLIDSSITIHKLEIFCLVVQLRSVTKAAERLGIAQPAVTSHLRHLESKLGLILMQKQGRSFKLTDGGERVYHWAREIVGRSEEFSNAIGQINKGLAGTVTLAATMAIGSYRLAKVVVGFQAKHPNVCIITQITNPVLATEAIRSGACDLGVMLLDPLQPQDELVVEMIWDEPLFLVARSDSKHLKPNFGMRHISEVPFVTPPVGLVTRGIEDSLLRVQGITKRRVALEFGHPEACKQAVLADVAIGFVLASCVEADIQRNDLIRIDIPEFRHFTMPVFLVYRRNKLLSGVQKGLIQEIRREIARPLLVGNRQVAAPTTRRAGSKN